MKATFLATGLAASLAVSDALPASFLPSTSLSVPNFAQKVIDWVSGGQAVLPGGKVSTGGSDLFEGMQMEKLLRDEIEYDLLTHPAHPEYKLRITSSNDLNAPYSKDHAGLCDPNVKQVSGYLDISENKHLFFWFFESRNDPSSDPLVLWLNGGPGCSSTTGLLFELGPCMIASTSPKGENINTTYNPYSWTNKANIVFLDQPVGVGYSYEEGGGGVNNSPAAAEDVYAFLTLFVGKYKQYRKLDLHVAGESYAGTYIPNIAHVITTSNAHQKSLAITQLSDVAPLPILNLASVLIGNGLTNPAIQFASVPEYACDSEYAVYKDAQGPECTQLRSKMQRCKKLANTCYNVNNKFVCVPATLTCWSGFSQLQDLKLNLYDTRRACDRSEDADGPLCYREMGWIEKWMNQPEIKKQLGAPSDIEFKSCNMDINKNFLFQADVMHRSSDLLIPVVEGGVRVLIYAGVRDLMCNYIGNEQWLNALETSYQKDFLASKAAPFIDSDKNESGYVRHAGKGAGNIAFVAVSEAGHMVPQDQPQASLDMFNRWLDNVPLAKGK